MSSRRFFGIVFLFSVILCVVGQCSWNDFPNRAGENGKRTALGDPPADLANCKTRCEAEPDCLAIDSQSPFCFKYTTATTTSQFLGTTHAIKSCTPACTIQEQTDTGVTSTAQVTVDLTAAGDCENLCKTIPQCLAYSHTSGTCELHTSDDISTSTTAGYVYARKQNCFGNDDGCCFTEAQADTRGSTGTTTTLTQSDCQSSCLAVSECQGVSVSGTTCHFYTGTPSTTTRIGSTYHEKTCPSGADRGSLTLSACGSASNTKLSQVLVLWTLVTALFLK